MQLDQHEQRIQTVCLLSLTAVAGAAALWWLKPVMIPLVLALFLATALSPMIDLQIRRLRLPRPIAIVSTFLLGLGALVLLGALVVASIEQMEESSQSYQDQFTAMFDSVSDKLPLEMLGLDSDDVGPDAWNDRFGSALIAIMSTLGNLLSQGVLVLLFLLFILIGRSTRTGPIGGLWGEVEKSFNIYLVTKIVTSGVTGLLTGLTLKFLGVEPALVFGLFAFLLNFIPNVGSFVAVFLPLPIILFGPDIGLTNSILALAVPGAIQFSIGNLIEPKFMGNSLDLHPVVVMFALIFWGMLWGIVGMLLAAPMTAALRVVLARDEVTAPAADLLAGRFKGNEAQG